MDWGALSLVLLIAVPCFVIGWVLGYSKGIEVFFNGSKKGG